MKRSRNLKLILMATVPMALTACQSEPTAEVVQSVEQCEAGGWMSRDQCEAARTEALAAHASSAPRFESRADCEGQFGQCTPEDDGQGRTSYMPPMSGFLLGYLLAGTMNRNNPGVPAGQPNDRPAAGAGAAGAAPLYRNRRGEFYNARGDFVSSRPGSVSGTRGRILPPGRATTVSRGGFGARGAFTGGARGS